MAKRGRQTIYSSEIAEVILARLAAGESLLEICETKGLPAESTVRGWAIDDAGTGFSAKYARARDMGLDHEADEIKRLADQCRVGKKTEEKEVGRECSVCKQGAAWYGGLGGWRHSAGQHDPMCQGATAEPVMESKTLTADMVERSKLQVDARKWRLSKMAPKRYGDRLAHELSGPDGGPVKTEDVTPIELLRSRLASVAARIGAGSDPAKPDA